MFERENLRRILKEAQKSFEEKNAIVLRRLSNETLHVSSATGDSDNILVAVILYSLSKILEREDYSNLEGWKSFEILVGSALKNSLKDLDQNNDGKFQRDFVQIRKAINKISGKLKKYIEEIFQKSAVNKASRIYEHGISLGRTAELLGVSIYDLANYTGQTGISEVPLNSTIDVKKRVKILEEIFNV